MCIVAALVKERRADDSSRIRERIKNHILQHNGSFRFARGGMLPGGRQANTIEDLR